MAKLVILSSDTGEGHNSTARAIFAAAGASGVEVSLRKPLEESGVVNRTLGGIYNGMLRHRPGWMKIYFRLVNRVKPNEAVWMYSAYKRFIAKFLRAERPDVLLSVHPMLNHLIQRHIREQGLGIPCYTLLTDPFPPFWKGWASPWVDRYFVSTPEAAGALTSMGVPCTRIDRIPLPVRQQFEHRSDPVRRRIREEFNLTGDAQTILVNGGARGGGPLFEVYRSVRRIAPGANILMVCGYNQPLRDRLERCSDPCLQTFGFVTDIHRHIAASDLVLTKPGALSTCEALASGTPVLLLGIGKALMPQESGMFEAARKYGFALTAADLDEVTRAVAAGPQSWRDTVTASKPFCTSAAAQELIERIHPHHVHV